MDSHDKAVAIIEHHGAYAMSPVVAAILKKDPSPETLREVLAVQREWEANEARKAYAAAMVGLQADLPKTIAHDKKVDFNTTKYTHTSLAAAVEAVRPHLILHGFSHSWHPGIEDGQVVVTCRLTHRAGHSEAVTLKAGRDPKGGKNDPQAVASSVTMLERYTLLGLLGIATADQNELFKEKQDEPDVDKVDSKRNLRAVGLLEKKGRTVEQAVKYLDGRPVAEWTESDLKKLEAWAKSPAPIDSAE